MFRKFLNLFRKYEWHRWNPNVAGFDFTDPVLVDASPIGKTVRTHKERCEVFKTTTAASFYWEKGDPVEPVYFAVGETGIYYDNKTVGPFWRYVTSKPIDPKVFEES